METDNRQGHWQRTYQTKAEHEVSWSQDAPEPSRSLIAEAASSLSSRIIDIGGGTSRLAEHLVLSGYSNVTVLDLSSAALAKARMHLRNRADAVEWIVADITTWRPTGQFDVWHDRATFHFMVTEADRAAYLSRLREALVPGGHAIVATFALDGPEKCSGLPVRRYGPSELAETLGDEFTLLNSISELHHTPWRSTQPFQFSVFRRRSAGE